MEVSLVDRSKSIPQELKDLVPVKLDRVSRHDKHFERAEVIFAKENNPRISFKSKCSVKMMGHGLVLVAHACGDTEAAALDKAIDKVDHLLERADRRWNLNRRRSRLLNGSH